MPRVFTKTKNRRGREYTCGKCGKPIEPGARYYSWTFRYGGTWRRHAECGYPRPSELTQSGNLSTLYAAREAAEDTIGRAETVEDIAAALNDAATEAEDVAREYEDAADRKEEYFPGTGDEIRERGGDCEQWASELQDAAQDIESMSAEDAEYEDEANPEEAVLEAAREKADEALGGLYL